MPMDGDFMGDQDMPQPPQDNNQVRAPKAPEYFVVVEEKRKNGKFDANRTRENLEIVRENH